MAVDHTEAKMALINWDLYKQSKGNGDNSIVNLQFTPPSLELSAESNWAKIAVMGRNNPHYHFTGGEDKLMFQLDWYANDTQRESAIAKAELVKSWSRADGYSKRPPEVKFFMGELFKSASWVLQSAPYTMELLMTPNYTNNSDIDQDKLCPVIIRQEITLLRVTPNNYSHKNLQNYK